ncbi:hypothetical protein FB451DRAFT_1407740 [Mycena latifolia]|nr:hypothetical protein FB451DRAFT_1407740 [Mycena latifolia]
MRTISTTYILLAIALAAHAGPAPPPSPRIADRVFQDEHQTSSAAADIFATLDSPSAPATQATPAEGDPSALFAREANSKGFQQCTIA